MINDFLIPTPLLPHQDTAWQFPHRRQTARGGKAPMHMQTIDYVLSNIKDNKTIDDGNTRGSYAVLDFLNGENSQNLMQKYN